MSTTEATTEQRGEDTEPTADLRRLARRGRLVTLVVVGVLVLAVGLSAALGGFRRRSDFIAPAEPGETLTTGPDVLSFSSGTVQHHTSDNTWQVVVTGSARTTATTSADLPRGDDTSTFVYAQDVGTRQVVGVDRWSYGPEAEGEFHKYLVPGAAPVDVRATFELAQQPQGKLRLIVLDQRYATAYVFGDEEAWQAERTGRDLAVPLQVLPETEY